MNSKILLPAAFAIVWACGGSTFTGGSPDGGSSGSGSGGSASGSGSSSGSGSGSGSSGGSSGSSSGSGSGGSTVTCPANLPAESSSCPRVGLECEYGDSANPSCNQIVSCESSGWSVPPNGQTCPVGTCPATYADVPQNKACSPAGLDCSYAQGQCDCTSTLPVATPNPVWECSTPAAGCPEPRPRIGASCTQPGLSCNYGACTGGAAIQCEDGVWTQEFLPCPV